MFGIPLLALVLYGIGFVAGVATLPILAYSVGGLLPGFMAEPLARLLHATAFFGVDRPMLNQTKTGEYEFDRASDEMEPEAYWTRYAFSKFAIGADVSEEAFGHRPVEASEVETEPVDGATGVNKVVGMVRGGFKSFVPLGETPNYYLPTGQLLSAFSNAGGLDLALDAEGTAEKEHGGDTANFGAKTRLVGHIVFAILGAIMGYLFFLGP